MIGTIIGTRDVTLVIFFGGWNQTQYWLVPLLVTMRDKNLNPTKKP
jgi:hypothetical protein